jgi:dTDP-4-dehydrorhamnose 3,5-epimerase-like enzyme
MTQMKKFYKIIELSTIADSRGKLTVIEGDQNIPFKIERIFYMHEIVSDRGGHAHKETDQIIIAMHGSYDITIDNGKEKKTINMNSPEIGLYLPRLTFTDFSNISQDAVILVLANTHYDMSKSIRSYEEFISYINK